MTPKSSPICNYLALGAFACRARQLVRLRKRMDLNGRAALITGGSRGLGLLIAREFLKRGCKVLICARSQDELDRAIDTLYAFGEAYAFVADITREEDCRLLFERAVALFGTVDILVNNAGAILSGPFETMKAEDYRTLLETHFWGPYRMVELVLPTMRKLRRGRIVNISSIGGKLAVPHLLPYSVSKFALQGYSEGLRAEVMQDGIYVTTVCPSLMRTGSQLNALFKGEHRTEYSIFKTMSAFPGFSIAADRAAKRIVRAAEYGEGTVLVGAAAKVAESMHAAAPSTVDALFRVAAKMLPRSSNSVARRGRDIRIPRVAQFLSRSIDSAAKDYNE
ncbi:MAG: SDR family oxidoreductase [Bdellovibrionota bacterium]